MEIFVDARIRLILHQELYDLIESKISDMTDKMYSLPITQELLNPPDINLFAFVSWEFGNKIVIKNH